MTSDRTRAGIGRRGAIAALLLVGAGYCFATESGTRFRIRSWLRLDEALHRIMPFKAGQNALVGLEPTMIGNGFLKPVWLEVEPGMNMFLDPADMVSRTILVSMRTRWQPEIWEALSPYLGEGKTYFDVGAHIGYFSLKSAKAVGATGRVVGFEPNPRVAAMFRDNVKASNLTNVTVVEAACTDVEQELTLYDATGAGNSGASSLAAANVGKTARGYKVAGRKIDNVVGELGIQRLDLMKVDVEGAETVVLKGALETLRKLRPVLVVEVIPKQLQNMGSSVAELEAVLASAGYKTWKPASESDRIWTYSE